MARGSRREPAAGEPPAAGERGVEPVDAQVAGGSPLGDAVAARRRARAFRRTVPRRPGERVLRFLAAMAFLCGVVSFAGSSVFDIHFIAVAGNDAVRTAEIVDRAGIRPGSGLFSVNAAQIARRLREDPRIEGVSVGVAFPDRLFITVRERTAAAALRVPGGYVLVAPDGVAIAPTGTPGALPALTVDRLAPDAVEPGAVVASADARFGAGIAASLPRDLRPDVTALRVDQTGEVILYLRDGIAIRAGGPDGIGDRLARAGGVLTAVRSRGMRVEYVDLRFPGSIIVKPLGGPAAPAGKPG